MWKACLLVRLLVPTASVSHSIGLEGAHEFAFPKIYYMLLMFLILGAQFENSFFKHLCLHASCCFHYLALFSFHLLFNFLKCQMALS